MDIKVNFKGGGSFVNLPPKFSANGENVFVAWNNSLVRYNTKTGKVISEYKGVSDRIIGFDIYSLGPIEFLIACLKNGEIVVWKVEAHFKIMTKKSKRKNVKTFNLLPICDENNLKAIMSYLSQGSVQFLLLDIHTLHYKKIKLKLKNSPFFIDVGSDYFCVGQNNQVHFIDVKSPEKIWSHNTLRKVTCVTCHPEDRSVLIGDNLGRSILWHGIFTSSPTQAVYHWHTLPVRCMAFSRAGSYFYSGGEECVIVRWEVDNNLEKKFLPRLPSTIVHMVPSQDNTYLAIATTDNGIRIVDSRFGDISLIQHLVIGSHFDCGIIYDPRTRALVMNGSIGQIQFYVPQDMSLLYKVDIVDKNKITNERECVVENTEVMKMTISKSGLWMATVEERKDEEYTPELRLKFWKFNTEKQNFELNSSIEFPHDKSINNIMFRPSNVDEDLKCVTIGQDCKFRIWQLMHIDTAIKKGYVWNCVSEGMHRSLPCMGISFSVDGSLIAIGFGAIVTTWLPDTCELKCSLVQFLKKDHVTHVEFATGNLCQFLVATTKRDLTVWNLLTLSVLWTVPLNVSLLISDPVTTNMAVITTNNKLFVFSPLESTPMYASDTLLKEHNSIVTATFVPSRYSSDVRLKWYQRSHLFFIDADRELYSVGGEEEYSESIQEVNEDTGSSLLSAVLFKSAVTGNSLLKPTYHMYEKDHSHISIKKYLEAPVHNMVPIRLSCKSILQSLIIEKA